MSNSIKTVSRPESHPEHRKITTIAPACLKAEDLGSLVEIIGEELVLDYAHRQLLISFRSTVRGMLEAKDDNDEIKHPDEYFTSPAFEEDMADWTPTRRVAKNPVDKVAEALKNLDPEMAAAVLAKAQEALAG